MVVLVWSACGSVERPAWMKERTEDCTPVLWEMITTSLLFPMWNWIMPTMPGRVKTECSLVKFFLMWGRVGVRGVKWRYLHSLERTVAPYIRAWIPGKNPFLWRLWLLTGAAWEGLLSDQPRVPVIQAGYTGCSESGSGSQEIFKGFQHVRVKGDSFWVLMLSEPQGHLKVTNWSLRIGYWWRDVYSSLDLSGS